MAVVKADGYGHDASGSEYAIKGGASQLGVALKRGIKLSVFWS